VRVTVAICTWNRCSILRQTLQRLTAVTAPAGVTWEVLIVNNNCTDATDEVFGEFRERLPLRRVFESKAGLSNARNAAIDAATGDYILWTDDDVLVDRDWVAAYVDAFRRWPDAAFFGGPIEPWFETAPPAWLEQTLPRLRGAFAIRDLGTEPRLLDVDNLPFGANMAVRADHQRRFRFDTDLGYRAGKQVGGEEESMMRVLLEHRLEGRWVPGARVEHLIPTQRQTETYVRKYYQGRGEFIGLHSSDRDVTLLMNTPWRLNLAIWKAEITYRLLRRTGDAEQWIEYLCYASELRGMRNARGTVRDS
jgi:glucosyl-dolichyl phosphate glucuronosyltransferase